MALIEDMIWSLEIKDFEKRSVPVIKSLSRGRIFKKGDMSYNTAEKCLN